MGTPLKALIAVTCVVLLGAVGWYAKTEIEDQKSPPRSSGLSDEIRDDIALKNCQRMVFSWGNGGEEDIRAIYGDDTEKTLSRCRKLLNSEDR